MSLARARQIESPETATRFAPGFGTERLFRNALGAFTTGVTVVTARGERGAVGITANSFASLSMDPPLVLWAPARGSKRFETFAQARHFAIHVLAVEQRDLALHFARQGHDFDLPGMSETPEGVPLISGSLVVLECTREAVHDGGDHAIVVGRVQSVQHREGRPLIFSAGRFGSFAPLDP